jgi:hypothetical protein
MRFKSLLITLLILALPFTAFAGGFYGDTIITTSGLTFALPATSGTLALSCGALGVVTATSVNGNFFTTGTYTLTGAALKTLTFNNTLTLAGTDSTTMTFPTTSATIARTDAANTFTGHQTIEGVTSTGATGTGKFVFDASPTISGHPVIEGVTSTGATGTGNFVFSASPTFTGTATTPILVVSTSASPAAADACTAGKIVWDASYIYVCTATGVWKRAALTGSY